MPRLTAPALGDPGGTRTPNLLIRSQVLYPIKLRDRSHFCVANITQPFFLCKSPKKFLKKFRNCQYHFVNNFEANFNLWANGNSHTYMVTGNRLSGRHTQWLYGRRRRDYYCTNACANIGNEPASSTGHVSGYDDCPYCSFLCLQLLESWTYQLEIRSYPHGYICHW